LWDFVGFWSSCVQGSHSLMGCAASKGGGANAEGAAGADELARGRSVKKIVSDPVGEFLHMIAPVPWGVLGLAQGERWTTIEAADPPDGDTLIVDPASIRFIRNPNMWPADAGGASGAIYKKLGLVESFPADVVAAIQKSGDVAYHRYGYPTSIHVLHCTGPDFKETDATREEAVGMLEHVYYNVLAEAARVGKSTLRLLPISAGIFSGPFRTEMPQMTAEALIQSAERLAKADPGLFKNLMPDAAIEEDGCGMLRVEFCLYAPKDLDMYASALKAALGQRGGEASAEAPAPATADEPVVVAATNVEQPAVVVAATRPR